MKIIIVILLSFVLLHSNGMATSQWTVQVGKSIKKIETRVLGGISHLSTEQIKKYVLKDTKYKKSKKQFDSKEYSLKYNVGSFFIIFRDWSGVKAVQLSSPVALLGGKHYFPAKSFFHSLDSLGLFTVSFSPDSWRSKGKHVILAGREFLALKSLKRNPNNLGKIKAGGDGKLYLQTSALGSKSPFSDAFAKLSKKLARSLKSYKPSLVEIYSPPLQNIEDEIIGLDASAQKEKFTPYIIPRGLIRKELDELHKK